MNGRFFRFLPFVTVFLVSCVSVPESPLPIDPDERLRTTSTALGSMRDKAGVSEIVVVEFSGLPRELLLSMVPASVAKRVDRVIVAGSTPADRSIWLEGRFGVVLVSAGLRIAGFEMTTPFRWYDRNRGIAISSESRRIVRIDSSPAASNGADLTGEELFSLWDAGNPGIDLGLMTGDRSRLPAEIEEAQAPFVPQEAVVVVWDNGSTDFGVALRTKMRDERTARVALVATRLGAQRTIDRLELSTDEFFAIERREENIVILGIVVPAQRLGEIAQLIEGGTW